MRLGKDSKSDSPNGNSASPASIACCDYYHPLLIASFVHIKLPPFPNCLRTCKSSLDVRTNHVQSQPTVTRAETGSLSAYLSGTESSLPSTPPFFFTDGDRSQEVLAQKRGHLSNQWVEEQEHKPHSQPGAPTRTPKQRPVWGVPGTQTLPQVTETPEHQRNCPKNSSSDNRQVHRSAQKRLCLFAQTFLKHPAWGRRSEQATSGQPVKNSAVASNQQRFYNRKYWANPTAGSTASPSFFWVCRQKRNRGTRQSVSLVFGPRPLSAEAHLRV